MSRPFDMPRRADLVAMLRLAMPVVAVQLGLMGLGVVDTMVVGRVSAVALAAVALGNLAMMSVMAFGFGVLMVLDPLVSQAVGAGDQPGIRRAVQRGMLLAIMVTVPSSLVLLPIEPLLLLLRQPPEIVPLAAGYVYRSIPGLLPFFAFVVLRQTLQAMKHMRPIVLTIVFANLVNLFLDLGLVHGRWGLPALGALGSAWATTLCRVLLLALLLVMARAPLRPVLSRLDRESLRLLPLWRTLALGLPIGVQIQLEFTAFGVIALLMGGLGTIEMAAHQVAINLASLTFMVPVGVSAAASVHVGHAVGRGDGDGLRRAASAALVCGAGFMSTAALAFLLLPELLAAAYTSDLEVRRLAALLIPIAGVFQIFDGLQVVSAGILRGLGDTRAPMLINVLGFWFFGMPVSVALAFPAGLGPAGLWWGLVVALGAVAALLLARSAGRLKRPFARVLVD